MADIAAISFDVIVEKMSWFVRCSIEIPAKAMKVAHDSREDRNKRGLALVTNRIEFLSHALFLRGKY